MKQIQAHIENSMTLQGEALWSEKAMRLMALAAVLMLLSACGAKVQPRATASSSGSGPVLSGTPLPSNTSAQAECTGFDTTSTRMSGKVTTYYYNGTLQEDVVRLRFSTLNESFDSNANSYIQMFRWRTNSSGGTELDPNPVQFRFESGNGSVSPISDFMTSINARQIADLRSRNSMTGTTALDFFSKTTITLHGLDYNWQALKIVLYDGSSTIGSADVLLPVFLANPNRYAAEKPLVLAQLHPFYSQRSSNLSEQEWQSRAGSACF
jgi:hypothetical protein